MLRCGLAKLDSSRQSTQNSSFASSAPLTPSLPERTELGACVKRQVATSAHMMGNINCRINLSSPHRNWTPAAAGVAGGPRPAIQAGIVESGNLPSPARGRGQAQREKFAGSGFSRKTKDLEQRRSKQLRRYALRKSTAANAPSLFPRGGAGHACRAEALLIARLVVHQAVNDTTFRVKARNDAVKITGVTLFVTSPSGPCHKVRQLDDARHSGIDEQRHLGEVSKFAPARSAFPESLGEILQSVFVVGFVHNDQAALSFLRPPSRQPKVKAIADFFKGVFHRILGSNGLFMHGDGEQTDASVGAGENIKRAVDDFKTTTPPHCFPRPGFSACHVGSMQLGGFRILQVKIADELVDFLNNVVYLPLENGNASENEISFVGIFDGPGAVDVK